MKVDTLQLLKKHFGAFFEEFYKEAFINQTYNIYTSYRYFCSHSLMNKIAYPCSKTKCSSIINPCPFAGVYYVGELVFRIIHFFKEVLKFCNWKTRYFSTLEGCKFYLDDVIKIISRMKKL